MAEPLDLVALKAKWRAYFSDQYQGVIAQADLFALIAELEATRAERDAAEAALDRVRKYVTNPHRYDCCAGVLAAIGDRQ